MFKYNMLFLLTAEGNAAREVLDNPQYAGALHTVQSVTSVIDSGFAMFITITAFFIMMAGLAKNVAAGAYVAWPDLWDKVDDAHTTFALNAQLFSGGGQGGRFGKFGQLFQGNMGQSQNNSTLATLIYCILPNFKAMTPWGKKDEQGNTIDAGDVRAKDYFIKAIPQLVAIVFIGVFIYNGFYRDLTIKATDFGSEAFRRVISKADPMALVDKAVGTLNKPDFEASLGKDMKSKSINSLSSEVYDKTVQIYTDLSNADVQRALASTIESKVNELLDTATSNIVSNMSDTETEDSIWNPDRYSVKFQVSRVAGVSNEGNITANNTNLSKFRVRTSGVDQLYQYFTISNLYDSLGLADKTLQSPDQIYSINIAVVWTRKLERAETNSSKTVTLEITANTLSLKVNESKSIEVASNIQLAVGSTASGTAYDQDGNPRKVKITKGDSGATNTSSIIIVNEDSMNAINGITKITGISGLNWVTTSDNKTHRVTAIELNKSKFLAIGTDGSKSDKVADSPTHSAEEKTEE